MKPDFLFKIVSLPAAAIMVSAILTACADDDMGVAAHAGKEIRFDVTDSRSWSQVSSRGGVQSREPDIVALVSGADSLYLTAVESTAWPVATVGSRAVAVKNSDDISSVGVFATRSDLSVPYMDNVEVTKAAGWTPAKEYLWPGDGALHINAYSPYTSMPSDEGISSVPDFDESDSIRLRFVTPADVAGQIDLMYAVPCDASASPCQLEMNHALTSIRFVAGQKLAPCKVLKIEIEGVASEAILNLESGEWSALSGNATYAVAPDITLETAPSSEFVTPGETITSDNQTFILLPQRLTADSRIVLTVDVDGNTSTFDASLEGQIWSAGRMVTYRLSATPDSPKLSLSVVDSDGNAVNRLAADYTGSQLPYTVKSFYSDDQPVEWDATLVDKDGNTLTASPDWIISYATQGSGHTDCMLTTDMITPEFRAMSDETRALRGATDINVSSGTDYYNLSNSSGASTVENTANCYLINAPGKYCLPLVYGNAVKDGAPNTGAYVSTLAASQQSKALLTFINHLGNPISDPYIYNNAGCVPDSARLLWEEKVGMMRNVCLSADKKSLQFEVPAQFIRQGNAVVAVIDKDGTVMWSWHLWVTSHHNGEDWQTITDSSTNTTYNLYPLTLGRVYAGDHTVFPADSVTMRLTQKNVPDGLTPLSVDLTVALPEKSIVTKDYYGFYQWGRKDPMFTGNDFFYDQYHNEISSSQQQTMSYGTNHKEEIANSIMHPDYFMTGTGTISPYYVNLWSIDNVRMSAHTLPENVKTIYDPCPVGAKVPIGNVFVYLMKFNAGFDSQTNTFNVHISDTEDVRFPMLGYRSRSGSDISNTDMAGFWTAASTGSTHNRYFDVSKTATAVSVLSGDAYWGFGVRPVKE